MPVKELQGPEADNARTIAQPVLEDVCSRSGQPIPTLHIVDKLWGGSAHTAQATRRGAGGILLPASLALAISHDALEHLLAHELGHLALRRSGWVSAQRGYFIAFILFGVALIATYTEVMLGSGAPAALALPALCIPFIGAVLLFAYVSRKHESECDVFAARLQGHLAGADELMTRYEQRRKERGRSRRGRLARIVATHPEPAQRMATMREALATTSAR